MAKTSYTICGNDPCIGWFNQGFYSIDEAADWAEINLVMPFEDIQITEYDLGDVDVFDEPAKIGKGTLAEAVETGSVSEIQKDWGGAV